MSSMTNNHAVGTKRRRGALIKLMLTCGHSSGSVVVLSLFSLWFIFRSVSDRR